MPSHQEAVRAAIAAKADGIVSSSPDPGSLVAVVKEAGAAGIPIININTPDPTAGFDAYVGGDLLQVGKRWAQYLVDHQLVKQGDFVWMPVEVPGATYGVQEEEGIASVFKPLGITWEVTDNTLDQVEVITRMSDYLTANRAKIKAIIGLGDMVTGSIKRVFEQVGVAPGEIPVVGWGNSLDTTQEVLSGYVNAGMWQDPQATSYIGLSLAAMARSGIPPGSSFVLCSSSLLVSSSSVVERYPRSDSAAPRSRRAAPRSSGGSRHACVRCAVRPAATCRSATPWPGGSGRRPAAKSSGAVSPASRNVRSASTAPPSRTRRWASSATRCVAPSNATVTNGDSCG